MEVIKENIWKLKETESARENELAEIKKGEFEREEFVSAESV